MKSSDFSKDELKLIEGATTLYDTLDPIIKKKVKEPRTWQELLRIIKAFMYKNQEALSTNIIGKQVIVNNSMEEDILRVLEIDRDLVKKSIKESEYFKKFGELQLTNQLCLGIPLILTAVEYKRLGKVEESKLSFLLAFYKPYASRCSLFFKFNVNEGQMNYTVEHMTDRFDLKQYGTLANVLVKRAESSYNNYIEPINKIEKVTDKELHVMYTSGVASRVNSFLKAVWEEYRKNDGKSIEFEGSAATVTDKDTGEDEYVDNDIASDASVKMNEVNKVMNKLANGKVDIGLAAIAAQYGFGSSNATFRGMLVSLIQEVLDKMYDELPLFFTSLIGSFLFHIDPKTGSRYGVKEYRSPVFINVGVDILAGKKSNLKDINMLKAREIFKKMLNEHSNDYLGYGQTSKKKFERALALYWVLALRK